MTTSDRDFASLTLPLQSLASTFLQSISRGTSQSVLTRPLASPLPQVPDGPSASTAPTKLPVVAKAQFPRSRKTPGNSNNAGKGRYGKYIRSFALGGACGSISYLGGGVGGAEASRWSFPKGSKGKKDGADERKRILILMSDTGGGHRASAQALMAGFEEQFGSKYKIDMVDIWSNYTPWPQNQLPKTYSALVKYGFIWRLGYYTTQPRFVHVPVLTINSCLVGKYISKVFDEYKPDLVVSVHPLMQLVPLRVLQARIKKGLQPPTGFATVVTDLVTCHNTWFHKDVTRCFVPTQGARLRALRMGLREAQITVHGLPIRPAFSHPLPPKRRLRQQLGMDLDKPAVLLVGGGEGMGPVEKTVNAVMKTVGSQCQLVVICGRNKRLISRLQTKVYPEGMHVMINGFVSNMNEFMAAADCIVTKAGPGTIAESCISGLPLLLNGFVPCQEYGNVQWVLENKVGAFERDPAKVAEVVHDWFGERRAEFEAMAARAKALGAPHALARIVNDLALLVR